MRRGLIVLLSLGVVLGFGSGFARVASYRHGGGCHDRDRWSHYDGRGDRYGSDRFDRGPQQQAAPVQQQAPVYIVVPSAPAQAPVIVNNAPAPAPTQAPIVITAPAPAPAQ